jgi:hypothetical protein
MNWPTIEAMSTMHRLPEGYRYEQLARAEIPALIAGIEAWHPDIAIGIGSAYLRESFYFDKVFLRGEEEKDFYVVLIQYGDELAGMGSWEREPDALTLYARLGIVAPAHRGTRIAGRSAEFTTNLARAMGAGFVYGLATLKMPHMQLAMERAGYQLLGFVPGYDREMVAPGVVKRVYEAVYAKVLVPEDELLRPDLANLSPKARALWELLFPDPDPTRPS